MRIVTKKNSYPPDPDREKILEMFHSRCVMCGRFTDVIHEIIPRSSGKIAMNIENRVPLCAEHHDWAHREGTKVSIPILQKVRKRVLSLYADHAAEI